MELTLVIPTRDRRAVVLETMGRLARQEGSVAFEAIVVDDGSTDGTADAVEQVAAAQPFEVTVIRRAGGGPAAARNRGMDAARAPVCLFLNDDAWPRADLV